MEHTAVISSSLKSVGYNTVSRTLEIEFENDGAYQYFEVPDWAYDELLNAASRGQYFNENIRDVYEYRRKGI
ncbi:MAG: KTSC domain-containing protein [Chloroflexota bacterium]